MNVNLFGFSDAVWLMIDQWGTFIGLTTSVVTLVLLIWGAFSREKLRRWLTRNRFPAIGGALAEHIRYDGLVFTISKPETPAWVLDRVKPRATVFVVSEQSRGVADELKDRSTGTASLSIITIDNTDNPGDTRRAVRQAIEQLTAIGCVNIAVDVTGGKTPMSIGAFMAAEEAGKDSLYVSASYDPQLSKPDMRTAQITVVSHPANNPSTAG
jgi:hypothetical protein